MKRKSLSLVLALALALSLLTPALAAEAGAAAADAPIVILHTNDVHCAMDDHIGYAGLAAYKSEMEAQYGADRVTLVDVGDAIQGGPVGTLSRGAYPVDIMNQVGYDLAVPGNHEFDYGVDRFLVLAKAAHYPYLSCNFTDLTTGKTVFDPYEIIDYGTAKVAYVGICTPETLTKSTPTYFEDAQGSYLYGFDQGNRGQDLYAAVQAAIDAARAAGADYVVGLGHLGVAGVDSDWTSAAVIAHTTGMDALLDGHSHEELSEAVPNADGKNVVLAQAGTQLDAIGVLTIDPATGAVTSRLVKDYTEKDPATAAYVDGIKALYADETQKVVARSDVDLVISDPATGKRMVRDRETNLGDLCADAYRTLLGADVALVNGGGIRTGLAAGDITNGDILSVHPFGNSLCLVEATGQQILDALEMGARSVPEENGGFLQVSGLTYTIDASIPSSVVLSDEKEFVTVDGPYRVSDVKVGGQALDLSKIYKLASHDYLLKSGGDGLVMFKTCKILQDSVLIDNQALINYITGTLNGVVGSEYADPCGQGRITEKYVGVDGSAWYAQAARYAMDQSLMTSTGSGFDPAAAVTRATVFQALYNAEGRPAPKNASVLSGGVWAVDAADASFADTTGTWYSNAANWAAETGLAQIPGDRLFHGDRAVTRAELATVLARYAAYQNKDTSAGGMSMREMADYGAIPAWALPGMGVCYYNSIMTGRPGERLDPNGIAVRAELAATLMRYSALAPAA